MKKTEENLCDLWDTIKITSFQIIRVPEREKIGDRKFIYRNKG